MTFHEHKMNARMFNQKLSAAKRAAEEGPVVVTDRGRPTHVLMSYAEYERLRGNRLSALDFFADRRPEADFDFDPPRDKSLPREVDFD
ncbi:type II toxin-antitoxin system Phd/YefM family antitoxin [Jiella avicenniae]|uniref:Antitoxin n=1 Tax=Jiella avicenniae TaxID=2907202 RepID=A0A9X1P1E1_9HYPH|nr:type II toxin-antitoxin system Phd/YefM family antitoxin [Jiella avicenniae]MCE7027558.1 type II toxin-antitoxin system Phd/YefM family antitoxin [Jiella avicenniae]